MIHPSVTNGVTMTRSTDFCAALLPLQIAFRKSRSELKERYRIKKTVFSMCNVVIIILFFSSIIIIGISINCY